MATNGCSSPVSSFFTFSMFLPFFFFLSSPFFSLLSVLSSPSKLLPLFFYVPLCFKTSSSPSCSGVERIIYRVKRSGKGGVPIVALGE